jgi:hypothetical protein
MPKKLSEVLTNIIKRVNGDPEKLKDILSNDQIIALELEDELADKISGLMTVADAKTNAELYGHYEATFKDGFDKGLVSDMSHFDEATQAQLKGMKTLDRTKKIIALNKELAEKAAMDKVKGQDELKTLYQQSLDKYNSEKAAWEQEKSTMLSAEEERILKLVVKGKLKRNDYIDSIPEAIRDTVVETTLYDQLKADGAKLRLDGLNAKIWNANADVPYNNPKTNQAPSFDEYIDGILAAKGLLKVNGEEQKQNGQNQHQYNGGSNGFNPYQQQNNNQNNNQPRRTGQMANIMKETLAGEQ